MIQKGIRQAARFSWTKTAVETLKVYKEAYALAMELVRRAFGPEKFELSNLPVKPEVWREWPSEEKYSLTDQVRRSSRSVCANLREAWAKRRYEAHFVSKLTDADAENSETDTWLDFARDCQYITHEQHTKWVEASKEIGSMLGAMLRNPSQFAPKST